ncbi:conserved hypothetical protein [Vibrio coralliirubri]|uniref:hypothetical protein n=1 Tax=Vibrio coralliirubri TaxID=1516159 RepID=UPI00062F1336|nr:hypothetical protein [Vibrio coralliirubri]CDT52769.1 conserved hypothetical protein [Vibrio coralliirubri]
MNLTRKQRDVLQVILQGNETECVECVDLDQILERIPYETTKQSLQFSIRSLINKGLAEKVGTECRRGKSRQTFKATELTIKIFRPNAVSDSESVELES